MEAVADRSEVSVFSDGSGHEGGIGVVAVLYRGRTEKFPLRKDTPCSKLSCSVSD